MAILINKQTRLIVQGITGEIGSFQTKVMLDYGTKVVAGVTPGKGGKSVHGVPVYDLVEEAAEIHKANTAISFVPGRFAKDAAFEAIEAGLRVIVMVAEAVPNIDAMEVIRYAGEQGVSVLGPDTAGVISPGKSKVGVHPHWMFKEGNVGVLSRSGALSYETCKTLTENEVGQSTVVGIGGGPIWGLTQAEVLKMFERDDETEAVVLLGEIGGTMEERAAEYVREEAKKPVIVLIVGRSAPPGKKMGHAGAVIREGKGSAADKTRALEEAGALIAMYPRDIPELISSALKR